MNQNPNQDYEVRRQDEVSVPRVVQAPHTAPTSAMGSRSFCFCYALVFGGGVAEPDCEPDCEPKIERVGEITAD